MTEGVPYLHDILIFSTVLTLPPPRQRNQLLKLILRGGPPPLHTQHKESAYFMFVLSVRSGGAVFGISKRPHKPLIEIFNKPNPGIYSAGFYVKINYL